MIKLKDKSRDLLTCQDQPTLWKKIKCQLGHGNLAIILIGLLIVFAGRSIVLFLADRIVDWKPELVIHQVMPIPAAAEKPVDVQVLDKGLEPFEQLDEQNHIEITADDVIKTETYWNLNWWSQYLLKQMTKVQDDLAMSQERTLWLYRDDGETPAPGLRQDDLREEWLLCENQISTRYDRTWTLKTAWHPDAGLAYFRLDAPQYLHGELKADQAILDQATSASRVFISRLNGWLRNVTREHVRIPVILLDSWPAQPSRYEMEGMICHVIFDAPDGNGQFIVFYNVAIMEVVGFSGQLG